MTEASEPKYEVPIYKGTYKDISKAYKRLHFSYYLNNMGMTRQQARAVQHQVAKTYAILSGIPPLSTLIVVNMLYDMLTGIISSISPSMKYIIEPEDIRKMDPDRRMHHSVICSFDIHPIIMSKYQEDEYLSILMFACSKNGSRYNFHILHYHGNVADSPYIGCEHRNDFVFNPACIDLKELEQHVSGHICQFAAKKVDSSEFVDLLRLKYELKVRLGLCDALFE